MTPKLSIVIAALNGREYLSHCLKALQSQEGGVESEVIVATADKSVADYMKSAFPDYKVIEFDSTRSVAQLRAAAIRSAGGEIIAITEDHCIPDRDWFTSILRVHRNGGVAIGGVVDNGATQRLVDWAVYLCEYVNFASPLPETRTSDLPGPNVSYRRSGLLELGDSIAEEFWETFVNNELQRRHGNLRMDESVRVIHKMHFTFSSFLYERFHYGRAFAGKRKRGMGLGSRLAYAALAPVVLPPLMLSRISGRALKRGKYNSQLAASLPLIACFMLAGAIGECIGYIAGPGDSATKLR